MNKVKIIEDRYRINYYHFKDSPSNGVCGKSCTEKSVSKLKKRCDLLILKKESEG